MCTDRWTSEEETDSVSDGGRRPAARRKREIADRAEKGTGRPKVATTREVAVFAAAVVAA